MDVLCAKLASSDLVVLSCGGRDINSILARLRALPQRPATASLFPGIVVRSQFDAFLTRARCDHVLLNSPADARRYRRICRALGLEFNGIVYGASWFDSEADEKVATAAEVTAGTVFFEQIDVPRLGYDRQKLADMLIRLALRNPSRNFYVKTRTEKATREHNKRLPASLSCLLGETGYPANLRVCSDEVQEFVSKTDSCVTVSSSAAIEWLLAGQKVFLVSEFASRKHYSNFFAGSRLFRKLESLDPTELSRASRRWLADNVRYPELTSGQLQILLSKQESIREIRWGPGVVLRLWLRVLPQFIHSPRLTLRKLRNALNLVRWEICQS
ncbi:DUF6716 putative glycosyltransferase [Cupriavidus sp. DF5525]|uniref:DUF6716 putative glycosyltransferase n=1 Tax=Cupriavidus sp. DF5525 TaxID=3160989 RepID=UPI000426DCFF